MSSLSQYLQIAAKTSAPLKDVIKAASAAANKSSGVSATSSWPWKFFRHFWEDQLLAEFFHQPDSENAMNGLKKTFPNQIMIQELDVFLGDPFLCLWLDIFDILKLGIHFDIDSR